MRKYSDVGYVNYDLETKSSRQVLLSIASILLAAFFVFLFWAYRPAVLDLLGLGKSDSEIFGNEVQDESEFMGLLGSELLQAARLDTDGDGTPDVTDTDDDADGIADAADVDDDGDGIADAFDGTAMLIALLQNQNSFSGSYNFSQTLYTNDFLSADQLTEGAGINLYKNPNEVVIESSLGSRVNLENEINGELRAKRISHKGDVRAASSRITLGGWPDGAALTTFTIDVNESALLLPNFSGVLPVTSGGTGTNDVFTSGSVVFADLDGTYEQDNANFFWDNANNRLGLGDNTPVAALTVGAGDLFQVNASGAIAAATGITSSGSVTLSDLTPNRLVTTTTGGQLTNIIASSDLQASVTGTTGSGNLVFATSPTVTTLTVASGGISVTGNSTITGTLSSLTGFTSSGTITLSSLNNAGAVIFTNASGVLTQDTANFIWDDTNNRLGVGDATPAALFTVGTNDAFQVNASGDIVSLKGMTYSWPTAHEINGVLVNDGNGILAWGTLGGGSITPNSLDFTEFQPQLDLDTSTDIAIDGTEVLSLTNTGTGYSFRVNDASGDTTPFVIDASGNVGIGDSAPGSLFSVNGNATIGATFIGQAAPTNGLSVEGNFGLGVLAPLNKIDVKGGAVIGNAYAGVVSAPANGLLVEGRLGVGDTTPASLFTVGSGDVFQVDSNGDIVMIKNLTYSWPSSHVTSGVLTNNGSGTLTWGTIGGSNVTADSLDFTEFQDQLDLDASTDILITGSQVFSLTNTGTGNSFLVNDASGDTTPFVIDSSGRVGIGKSVPTSLLHLYGSDPIFTIENSDVGSTNWQIRNGATGASNLDIYNATDGQTMVNIRTDQVMIGTDTNYVGNASRLFVYGGTNGANIDARGDETIVGGDQATLDLQSSDFDTTGKSVFLQYVNHGLGTSMGFANSQVGKLVFAGDTNLIYTVVTQPLIFGTDNTERFRVLANGNFGIGDTTPASLFTVGSGDLFQIGSNGNLTTTNAGTWTFSNDTNFALSGGVNGLSFDTDTLSIDASNNRVGIGTTSPGVPLDVRAVSGAYALFAGDNTNSFYAGTMSGGAYFGNVGTSDLISLLNGVERMRVTNAGNVGIGDSSPAALFTVGSGDLFQVNSSGAIAAATGITSSGSITFSALTANRLVTTTTGGALTTSISSANIAASVTDETGTGALVFATNPTLTGVTVGSGGLTVTGDSTFTGHILPGVNDTYDLGSNSFRWRDLYLGGDTLHIGTSTTDEGTLGYNTTSNILNFGTDSTSNGDIAFFNDALYLDKSTGNVGIGTTSPEVAFQVHRASTQADLYISTNTNIGSANATQLVFASDNDGSPSYASLGQFNTGDLRFSAIGNLVSPHMTILTGGNVGIGTTSPGYKLDVYGASHIAGSTGAGSLVIDRSGSIVNRFRMFVGDGTGGYTTDENYISSVNTGLHFLAGASGTTEVMTVLSGGNVGIGESTPDYKLDVAGDIALDTNATYIYSTTSGGTAVRMLGINSSNTAYVGPIDAGPVDTIINASSSSNTLYLNTAGSARLTINSSGNVGIGTTSPETNLHIGPSSGATYNIKLGDGYASGIQTIHVNNFGQRLDLGNYRNTDTFLPGLSLLDTGTTQYVGIGTTAPQAKLHISAGDILLDNNQSIYNKDEAGTARRVTYVGTDGAQYYYGYHDTVMMAGVNGATYLYDSGGVGTARMTIASGGNVGIGTTGPDMLGSGSAAGRILGISSVTADKTAEIQLISTSTTGTGNTGRVYFGQASGGAWYSYVGGYRDSADNAQGIAFGTSTGGSASTKMYLTSGGNLGITTGSPVTRLSNSSVINTGAVSTEGINWRINEASKYAAGFKNANASGYGVHIEAGGASNALIVESGRVGIGTTTPNYKFTVSDGESAIAGRFNNYTATGTNYGIYSDATGAGTYSIGGYFGGANATYNFGVHTTMSAASNAWQIYASGTAQSFFGGNVGIGTSAPDAHLSLLTTVTSQPTFRMNTNFVGGNTIDFTPYISGISNGGFNLLQSGTSRMVISSGGYVGFGDTTPDANLHVSDTSNAVTIRATGGGSGYTAADLILESVGAADVRGQGVFMLDTNGGQEWYAGTPYVSADTYMIGRKVTGVHDASLAQLGNAFMTITNTGNVGIATNSPYSFGSNYATLNIGSTSKIGIIKFSSSYNSGNGAELYQDTSGNIALNINGSTRGMTMLVGGNVGIGTTAPSTKFVVSNAGSEGVEFIPAIGSGASVIQTYNRGDSTYDDLYVDALNFYFRRSGSTVLSLTSAMTYGDGTGTPVFNMNGGAGSSEGPYMRFSRGGSTYAYFGQQSAIEGGSGTDMQLYTNTGGIRFNTNASGTTRLYVASTGNVGINTTSPLLSSLQIDKASTYNSESAGGIYLLSGSADTGLTLGADAANDIAYIQSVQNGTSYSTRNLILNPNGANVGIGDITPSALFTVGSGDLFRVDSSGNVAFASGNPSITASSYIVISGGAYFSGSGVVYMEQSLRARGGISNDTGATLTFTGGTGGYTAVTSGNFGVGTSTPQRKLDVFTGDDNVASFGEIIGVGEYSGIHIGYMEPTNLNYRKGGLIFERTGSAAEGKVHILNDIAVDSGSAVLSDAKLTVSNNGYVGINNTNPLVQLQVGSQTGGLASPDKISLGSSFSNSAGTNIKLRVYDDGTNFWGLGVSSGRLEYVTNSSTSHVWYTGGNQVMHLNASGQVGIGTSLNPSAKLHVVDGGTGSDTTLNLNSRFTISGDSVVRWGSAAQVGILSWGGSEAIIGAQSGYDISFYTNGSQKARFNTGGNLTFSQVGGGMVGQYDPAKTQAIWAMGDSYILPAGGGTTSYGSLYGLGWSYNPDYGGAGNNPQSKPGLNHQLLLMQAGITTAALGSGFWTSGNVTVTTLISCGGIQTNGSGTMSCTSDERLKDVTGEFTAGLSAIEGINPQTYTWKRGTDLYDGGIEYSGFIAQNVGANIPEAMGTGSNGFKQINTTTILAASVNAIKELSQRTNQLTVTDTTLTGNVDTINTSLVSMVSANETLNGVVEANKVESALTDETLNTALAVLLDRVSNIETEVEDLQAQVANLEANQGNGNEEGIFANGISVTGLGMFDGIANFAQGVIFNSTVQIKNGLVATGVSIFEGVLVQNADAAGYVTIEPGTTEKTITFKNAYPQAPVVTITPNQNVNVNYYVSDVTDEGFVVHVSESAPEAVQFSWHAVVTALEEE